MSTTQPVRLALWRAFALFGAMALALALLPMQLATAQQPAEREGLGVNDLEAQDNVGAAISLSNATFDTAQQAILGRDNLFADNLASGALQMLDQNGLPLLLTESSQLSERTRQELQRLGVQTVHVLGGEAAIAPEVVQTLQQMGINVHRHAGFTRIETAIDIAQKHFPQADTAIISRAYGAGEDPTAAFADALAAGGWGADMSWPILLTQSDELTGSLRSYLEGSGITRVFVVGGEAAVSPAVLAELQQMGIEVARVSGPTRFHTAVAIAEARGFDSAAAAPRVILVPGTQEAAWASGFPAAAMSALQDGPVVLSAEGSLPEPTAQWIEPGAETTFLVCAPFTEEPACDQAAELLDKPFIELDTLTVAPGDTVGGLLDDPEGLVDTLVAEGCGFESEEIAFDDQGAFELGFADDLETGECDLLLRGVGADAEFETEFDFTVE